MRFTKLFCITLLIFIFSCQTVFTDGQSPAVFVNGQQVHFLENQPVIMNDRTMIPLREMFRVFAFEAAYHGDTHTVLLKSSELKVFFRIGELRFFIEKDGQLTYRDLDVAPVLLEWRTYVPLRAIAEVIGAEIEWNDETSSFLITME